MSHHWYDAPIAAPDAAVRAAACDRQAQLTKPPGSLGRLEELERIVEGPYVQALATHARAAVSGDVDLYTDAVDRFSPAGPVAD